MSNTPILIRYVPHGICHPTERPTYDHHTSDNDHTPWYKNIFSNGSYCQNTTYHDTFDDTAAQEPTVDPV